MARRSTAFRNADPQVTLYKAVRPGVGGAQLGPLFAQRGLDAADDPDGYQPTPRGTPLALAGGAYFTTNAVYALRLAGGRRYGRGVVVAVMPLADFSRLQAAGGILPDQYVGPTSCRVQPSAFADFNRVTAPPLGQRAFYAPNATLPNGLVVP